MGLEKSRVGIVVQEPTESARIAQANAELRSRAVTWEEASRTIDVVVTGLSGKIKLPKEYAPKGNCADIYQPRTGYELTLEVNPAGDHPVRQAVYADRLPVRKGESLRLHVIAADMVGEQTTGGSLPAGYCHKVGYHLVPRELKEREHVWKIKVLQAGKPTGESWEIEQPPEGFVFPSGDTVKGSIVYHVRARD